MASHSSTLAWKIPWTKKSGRLKSMGSQRVRHDWELARQHGFPGGSVVRNPSVNARDVGSIPGSGRSPGEGNGSSILAWRIPWTEEPGGLQLQRDMTEWLSTHIHTRMSTPATLNRFQLPLEGVASLLWIHSLNESVKARFQCINISGFISSTVKKKKVYQIHCNHYLSYCHHYKNVPYLSLECY